MSEHTLEAVPAWGLELERRVAELEAFTQQLWGYCQALRRDIDEAPPSH